MMRARCIAALAAAWLGAAAYAADSDSPDAATLEADDFTLDLETGVRTYRGAVAFRQGAFHLDCDELTTHHNPDGGIDRGVCRGAPGRFAQHGDERDEVRGRARAITLDNVAGSVVLEDDAEIEHGGHRIHGGRITYDLASRRIHVDADDGARARMTVQPRARSGEGE